MFAGQHLWDACVWADEMRLGCENALSMQIGVCAANLQSAANWRLGCKLAVWLQIGVWTASWRWAANWRLGCKLAFGLQLEFWLQNDVRFCSRRGHSDFPAPHIVCFPDNRPCGVCGAHLDCVPANSSSDFSGPHIVCFPANRACGVCGAATRCPANRPFGLFIACFTDNRP